MYLHMKIENSDDPYSGASATVVLVRNGRLTVVWIGDCLCVSGPILNVLTDTVHNFSSSHERARFHDQSDFEAKRTVWGETVGPERLWRVDLPHELPSFDIPHEKGFRDLDYGRGRAMWAADLGRDGRPRKIRNTFVDAARDICSTLRDREATFGTSVGMGDCVQYTGTTLSRALGHRAFRPRSDETNFPTDIEPDVRTVELGEGFQIVIIATSNAGRTVSKKLK